MIAHVVLFRLRPGVSLAERRAIIDSYAVALRDIPTIRRASVGRAYEEMIRTDMPYVAILEFDDLDGVRAYLDHPAHKEISTRFFAAIADTLIYDFEVEGDAEGLRGMLVDEGR